MRPVHDLERLHKSVRKRLNLIEAKLPTGPTVEALMHDRVVSFATIEAANAWASYSRALFLSTCRGAVTAARVKVETNKSFATDTDALRFAAQLYKNYTLNPAVPLTHRDEPNWFDPNVLLKCLDSAGASNFLDVGAALSFQGHVLKDLPTIRNFYAHRAENTARKVKTIAVALGVPADRHPTEVCLAFPANKSISVLRMYLRELQLLAELAIS